MKDLTQQQKTAVAKHFSGRWEDTHLVVAGTRIVLEIAPLKPLPTNAKPRLRFDKVVVWLMDQVQAALSESVPKGVTVLVTVSAPIRLPGKTAASLEEKVQSLLAGRSRDQKATIHGNQIHIRLLRNESPHAPKMIGFVHNPDTDPLVFLNTTSDLLDRLSAARKRQKNSWLVLMGAGNISSLQAYRYIYTQLRIATDYKEILLVFDKGRVESLTD